MTDFQALAISAALSFLHFFSHGDLSALLLCGCASSFAQVSPGPLSKAHHLLDSPLKCASYHTFGAASRKLRCLTCHSEIRELIARREGFHGRATNTAKGDLDCARCHTEHYGENFKIFQWPTTKTDFDHRTTGYPLLGRHAGLACAQCHNPRHISEGDRKAAFSVIGLLRVPLDHGLDGCHFQPSHDPAPTDRISRHHADQQSVQLMPCE
jgi:Cytochrome c3